MVHWPERGLAGSHLFLKPSVEKILWRSISLSLSTVFRVFYVAKLHTFSLALQQHQLRTGHTRFHHRWAQFLQDMACKVQPLKLPQSQQGKGGIHCDSWHLARCLHHMEDNEGPVLGCDHQGRMSMTLGSRKSSWNDPIDRARRFPIRGTSGWCPHVFGLTVGLDHKILSRSHLQRRDESSYIAQCQWLKPPWTHCDLKPSSQLWHHHHPGIHLARRDHFQRTSSDVCAKGDEAATSKNMRPRISRATIQNEHPGNMKHPSNIQRKIRSFFKGLFVCVWNIWKDVKPLPDDVFLSVICLDL